MKALQVRVQGGAMARVPADATAYAHRKNAMMCNVAAFYDTAEEKEIRQKWVNDFSQAIDQGENAAYVGFMSLAEQERLTEVYPPKTLERLRKVKRAYDPDNFFKLNFNVEPV